MSTVTEPKPKAKLNKATTLLFHIAARSHVLAEQFGIDLIDPDGPLEEEPLLEYRNVPRPWLEQRPNGEWSFDPDAYAKTIYSCSEYTSHMRLWILNVWNPNAAKTKGWTFDLFKALNGLDQGNREAIAWFLKHPIWP